MKLLLLCIILCSCGVSEPPQLVCNFADEIQLTDTRNICSATKKCELGEQVTYSRHLCFCDLSCLCFHASTEISDTCTNVEDLNCSRKGSLAILSKEFCLLTKNEREQKLSSTYQ